MSRQDINPATLKEELIDALLEVNNAGVSDDQLNIAPVGLVYNVIDIDNPMGFIVGETSQPIAGVAYMSARPLETTDRGAGISVLQFVILVNVSANATGNSEYSNESAVKANDLLYGVQRLMQGRTSRTGYGWMWGGHGLLPDTQSLNDGLLVYQQVWEVKHGYKGCTDN